MTVANDSITVTPGAGATVATNLASGKEYQAVVLADSSGFVFPGHDPVSVAVSESVANQVAAVWSIRRQWLIPSGTIFKPSFCVSSVTTAGSRTLLCAGQKLGSFNVSTNAFTDGASVAAPLHYSRLFAIVTTVMSAVANTVTVTYTNELGTAGKTTTALSIPASAPVGTAFEFALAVTTGIRKDCGVRDVTAVADTAAPTGVLEIWGMNPIVETNGGANLFEAQSFDSLIIPDTETLFIMFNQAAVTAQQRSASIVGSVA